MANQNNNQKYNDLGDQIKNSVLEALSTGDFTGLSDSIAKSVNVVIGDVGGQISKAAYTAANSAQTGARNAAAAAQAQRYQQQQQARIERNKQLRAEAARRMAQRVRYIDNGAVSSVMKIIFGSCIASFCGLALLGALVEFTMADLGPFIVVALFTLLGIWMVVSGVQTRKLLGFARRLRDLVKDRFYVSLKEVESVTGKDHNSVVRDVKKALQRNYFPEGRLDEEETTFMASKAVYEQYLETKKHKVEEAKEGLDKQGVKDAEGVLNPEQLTELNSMMAEGSRAIVRLHELNDEIPGEVITAKLDKTENLLHDIFERVKDHPDQMKNCHKLMDYYLPTMLKLVEAYDEYDKVTEPGPDIIKAKDEIEKTIDTINGAFTELLNKLFRDSVWDVTADARVLQSMLGQDGLAREEMDDLSVSIADTEI